MELNQKNLERSYKFGFKHDIENNGDSSFKAIFHKESQSTNFMGEFASKFSSLQNANLVLSLCVDLQNLSAGKHKLGCSLSLEE
jgi:hypothetical protein